MLTVHDLEVRVGPRVLMSGVSFRVGPGDRVGLVGRNGAGKTTLTRILAGEAQPAGGTVTNNATIGHRTRAPVTFK
jgi:ATPase subunit of ABC transporter with duplicated ATPase domains